MLEVCTDPLWQFRQLAHVTDRCLLELRFAARRCLARHRLLQIGVQPLLGIQLRAVRRQIEHLDLRPVRGQPIVNLPRSMRGQAVQDQENLAADVADQAAKKTDHHRGGDRPLEIIQRTSPLLVTAAIRLSPARLWQTRTTGVRPRGA